MHSPPLLSFLLVLALTIRNAIADPSAAHQKLIALATAGGGIIDLDMDTLELLLSPDRHWSSAIHTTDNGKLLECSKCNEFIPSWTSVANAWTKVPEEHRNAHFFATLDLSGGHNPLLSRDTTAVTPVVFAMPPTQGPRASAEAYDLLNLRYKFDNGFGAEPLAEFISKYTPIPIPYPEPFNWARWITIGVGILSVVVGALRWIAAVVSRCMISGFGLTGVQMAG
ncbi:hypothetical protein FB45DRAFT_839468 [Roridomyces roridus]|uniref:Uncharacterized protein n=1 Tax=Roridomyces roridus TaxID=1738132 RepID=A0AAD7FI66_9AGAR|nr:hypothetical protein FB45DRAFT_839468 [Roridomyces roridus]